MRGRELKIYETVVKTAETAINDYIAVVDDLVKSYDKTVTPPNRIPEFDNYVKIVPLFLISQVICKNGHVEDFQSDLVKKIIVDYSIQEYGASEITKCSHMGDSSCCESLKNMVGISNAYCTQFWKDIFEMVFCTGKVNALTNIVNAIALVPVVAQSPLGIAFNTGDFTTTKGGEVVSEFADSLRIQVENYRQEMLTLHAE